MPRWLRKFLRLNLPEDALHAACLHADLNAVEALLESSSFVLDDSSVLNESVFTSAVRGGSEAVLKAALGACSHPRQRALDEALVVGVYERREDLARLLLRSGADPQAVCGLHPSILFRQSSAALRVCLEAGGKLPPEIQSMLNDGDLAP